MSITKNKFFVAVVALLLVAAAIIWYFAVFSAQQDNKSSVQRTESGTKPVKASSAATDQFATLKGDAFDEAFIGGMLAHHEGAINMAEQAMAMTSRDEIRMLASNITQTQSLQLIQMRDWQKAWGFEITSSGGHLSHSGSGTDMAGDMVEMMDKLKDLTGEQYDKEFLRQMILHHEQAIEMAGSAATNAKRQEVKDLASSIIAEQTTELSQMKTWQKEWGYES